MGWELEGAGGAGWGVCLFCANVLPFGRDICTQRYSHINKVIFVYLIMRARNWSILFLWLVVLFFFFAGFYGFIVPSNKASVNKYGFHILEQLETAIQNKIDADLDTYANNLDTLYNATDTIVPQWVKQRLIGMGVEKAASGRNPEAVPGTSALAAARADSLQTMDTAAPRKERKANVR